MRQAISLDRPITDFLLEEALAHLGAAKAQMVPEDDLIIREHLLVAYNLLQAYLRCVHELSGKTG